MKLIILGKGTILYHPPHTALFSREGLFMESEGYSPLQTSQSGSVILDNATARGALIALGVIRPSDTMTEYSIKVFDSHVACAEILIESILFHDYIYLPKVHGKGYPYVLNRMQSLLGKDILLELPFTEEQTRDIEQFAEQDFAAWPLAEAKLRKRLREFSGIEVPIVAWDRWIYSQYARGSAWRKWNNYLHSVSDYYVKRLDIASNDDIYSPSFSEHSPSNKSEQIDAAILWLTYRTCVYDWIAHIAGIPYVPHPQRAALWKAINIRRSQPEVFNDLPYDVLFDARITVGTGLNKSIGTQLFELSIPPFFTYVLSKSHSPSDILNVALEVRSKRGVRALRNKIKEISESLFQRGSVLKIQKLINDFEKLKKELAVEYYAAPASKITPSIQVAGFIGAKIDKEIPVRIVKMAARFWSLNKPHLAFLRDVFKTTIDIWKLSQEYDRLFLGRRTLSESTIAPPQIINSPPDCAVPDARGDFYITLKIEDPEYVAPIECRRKLDEFLSSAPDSKAFLALIDIDNMDSIHNARGRVSGDTIINEVGIVLREVGIDLLSRVAGDTFIAIKFDGAATLESSIRIAVDETSFHEGKTTITASVGSAISPNDGVSADALLKMAYQRLEAEKNRKKGKK